MYASENKWSGPFWNLVLFSKAPTLPYMVDDSIMYEVSPLTFNFFKGRHVMSSRITNKVVHFGIRSSSSRRPYMVDD